MGTEPKLSKVVVAVSVAEAMAGDVMQEMFRQGAYARSLLGAVIGCCDAAGVDVDGFLRHLRAQNGPGDTLQFDEGAVGSVAIPREALANLALALLPHLTGDELRRVAEAMPRVAGGWTTGSHRSGFWRSVGPMRIADVFHPMAGDYWTADVLLGVGWVDLGNHPTARAAQAACDARLEAAGVRLCGERVREEGT